MGENTMAIKTKDWSVPAVTARARMKVAFEPFPNG